MRFPLSVPGMEGHVIEVSTKALGLSPQLLIDGFPAPAGPGKGEWLVYRPDGTTVTVKLTGSPFDIVPQARVNGRSLALAEPLQGHEWLLIGLPLILLFLGLAGAIIGGLAAILNASLLRSRYPAHLRSLGALGVTFLAFLVVLPLAVAAHRHHAPPPDSGDMQPAFSPGSFFHHRRHHRPAAAPVPTPAPPAPDTTVSPAPDAPTSP